MSITEWVGVAFTGAGMCFGFGIQSGEIRTLKRNMNDLGNLHKTTVQELHESNLLLARIGKDIEYLKEKVNNI
jgi:hypothetical protein